METYIKEIKQRVMEVLTELMNGDRLAAYIEWKKIFPRSVLDREKELQDAWQTMVEGR